VRIDKNLPDIGKRKGSSVLGGMRWDWEEEVIELPVEGMLRVDVRSHPTGEFVDDSRPADKPTTQKLSPSTTSSSSDSNAIWTTVVTGVVSRARSDLMQAAPAIVGNLQNNNPGNPNANPGGTPGSPKTPGAPGGPGNPNNPGNPGGPPPRSPPQDR